MSSSAPCSSTRPVGQTAMVGMVMRDQDAADGPPAADRRAPGAAAPGSVSSAIPVSMMHQAVAVVHHPHVDVVELEGSGMRTEYRPGTTSSSPGPGGTGQGNVRTTWAGRPQHSFLAPVWTSSTWKTAVPLPGFPGRFHAFMPYEDRAFGVVLEAALELVGLAVVGADHQAPPAAPRTLASVLFEEVDGYADLGVAGHRAVVEQRTHVTQMTLGAPSSSTVASVDGAPGRPRRNGPRRQKLMMNPPLAQTATRMGLWHLRQRSASLLHCSRV